MEVAIFYQLSLVLAIAAAVSLVFRLFKQPLVMGYIVTGFLVGPSLLNAIHDHAAFESFSQIGISLLLFLIGLGLNVSVVRSTGKPVLVSFGVIIVGLGLTGLGLGHLLDFRPGEALVMAGALLFSSTIIVIKALSDKKEQTRLYGQLAIGILLAEDIAATIALVLVASSSGGSVSDLAFLLLKGVGLGAILTFLGAWVLPRFAKLFAGSQELLYVFALAWAFSVASAFQWAGFSLEVGALFAGVALSHLPYAQAISTKLRPLRDFFIVLFFITIGESLSLSSVGDALLPAIAFSLLVMVAKPLLTLASLGALGYTKQTGFKAAIHLSQISEFSIVLVALAHTTGIVGERGITVITLTALFTIAISTYLMKYDDRLFRTFKRQLSIFERGNTKRELKELSHYPLVLLGYHEGGHQFVQTFRKMKKRYVVIDYDPDVIDALEHQHISHIYGDVTDTELLDEISIHRSELVISTIPDPATNHILVKHITAHNDDAIFICHAATYDEAAELYRLGAAYVILPQFIGTENISEFVRRHGSDKKAFNTYRKKHQVSINAASLHK